MACNRFYIGSYFFVLRGKDLITFLTVFILIFLSYPYLLILHTGNLDSMVLPILLCATLGAHKKIGIFSVFLLALQQQ